MSTTVVILMGMDAVGRRLGDATHRVEEAMRFTLTAGVTSVTTSDADATEEMNNTEENMADK